MTPTTTSSPPRATCSLCGLPLAASPRAGDRSHAHAGVFCCPGCAVVFSLLRTRRGDGADSHAPYERTVLLVRLGVAIFLAFNVMMLSMALYGDHLYGPTLGSMPASIRDFFRWTVFLLSLPAVWLLGEIQWRGVRDNPSRLQRSYHLLILVSVGGAFVVSATALWTGSGDIYFDTCVMLLVLVTLGRLLEGFARVRATEKLERLLDAETRPWEAARDGAEPEPVALADLRAGDELRLRIGDRVPVDAEVLEGSGEVSSECRDGEVMAALRAPGDRLRAGDLVVGAPLRVRLVASAADGSFWLTYCRLARAALAHGGRAERFAFRVAAVLLPLTMALAIGTLAVGWAGGLAFSAAAMRALSVLVVACPCAMGIASPVALRLALGRALRLGVLPESADLFERLARVNHVVIDNTGTLTARRPTVGGVVFVGDANTEFSADELAALRLLAEASRHPAAQAVADWLKRVATSERGAARVTATDPITHVEHDLGAGVRLSLGDHTYRLGSRAFLEAAGCRNLPKAEARAASIHFAVGGAVRASFQLESPLRADAERAIFGLLRRGMRVSILTGADALPPLDERIAAGLTLARASQSPADKVAVIEALRAAGEHVAMVGDGLNDLPALRAADVGLALGDGSEAPTLVADATLPEAGVAVLPRLVDLARRTRLAIVLNLAWVVGYNAVALSAAAFGLLHPLLAALLMIGSSAMVVLNSVLLIGGAGEIALGGPGARHVELSGPVRASGAGVAHHAFSSIA